MISIIQELAKKFKKEKNLVIAKMDASANDTPKEYPVEGFPTIYFATRYVFYILLRFQAHTPLIPIFWKIWN